MALENLNIETKEDSPQKLAAIEGIASKYFLSANEINQIVSYVNSLNQALADVNGISVVNSSSFPSISTLNFLNDYFIINQSPTGQANIALKNIIITATTLPTESIEIQKIYILPDGSWNFYDGDAWRSNSSSLPSGFETTSDGNFVIQDINGNIAFKIFDDGKVEFTKTTDLTKSLFTNSVKITGKKISILGDSISTTNGGGTGIAEVDTYGGLLAMNNNCQIFRNAVSGSNLASEFTLDARINSLNSVFEPEIILVFGGVNDFLEDTPLGVFGDTTTATFYGGMDVLCKKLLTRYPNARIFFMTPLHHIFSTAGGLIPEFNGQNYMSEFVEAIEKIAKRYGLSVINTNQNSGITCYNISILSTDNIHPKEIGHQMIYRTIINETNNYL